MQGKHGALGCTPLCAAAVNVAHKDKPFCAVLYISMHAWPWRSYTGFWNAVGSILAAEGPLGLYRGMHANMLKIAVGSAMQLAVYDTAKAHLERSTQ